MPRKTFHSGGPNAEDKALEVWSDVIIDKLEHLSKDAKWEQPWFDKEGLAWPKNMSGRQYSGMKRRHTQDVGREEPLPVTDLGHLQQAHFPQLREGR